ncbi:hypothetical protein [Roseicyclus sediminis]|uniref:hypothetical protein n=1 Tax=Roseicyclus sediminis TaxID=2980997 RepID=UPI0021D27E57|nr:hypothetical protein [Roseibacterium sp. SDUM158016]
MKRDEREEAWISLNLEVEDLRARAQQQTQQIEALQTENIRLVHLLDVSTQSDTAR